MLFRKAWQELEQTFGPHKIDLTSLDSNAQIDNKGKMLRDFTPFLTPHSSGVKIFAQTLSAAENTSVFPPFVLVGPLLRFLLESELCFTIVVPKHYPLSFWWPILISRSHARLQLGSKGDLGILLFPSPNASFVTRPLPWDLFAFRVEQVESRHFSLFLSQSRRPRIWRPAVPCPQCASTMTHLTFVRGVDLEEIQLLWVLLETW